MREKAYKKFRLYRRNSLRRRGSELRPVSAVFRLRSLILLTFRLSQTGENLRRARHTYNYLQDADSPYTLSIPGETTEDNALVLLRFYFKRVVTFSDSDKDRRPKVTMYRSYIYI